MFDRRKMQGRSRASIREAGGGNTGDLAACYCREKLRTWGEEVCRRGESLSQIYAEPIRIYYATCYAMRAYHEYITGESR